MIPPQGRRWLPSAAYRTARTFQPLRTTPSLLTVATVCATCQRSSTLKARDGRMPIGGSMWKALWLLGTPATTGCTWLVRPDEPWAVQGPQVWGNIQSGPATMYTLSETFISSPQLSPRAV